MINNTPAMRLLEFYYRGCIFDNSDWGMVSIPHFLWSLGPFNRFDHYSTFIVGLSPNADLNTFVIIFRFIHKSICLRNEFVLFTIIISFRSDFYSSYLGRELGKLFIQAFGFPLDGVEFFSGLPCFKH